MKLAGLTLIAVLCLATHAEAAESLSSGRFQNMQVYRPAGEVRSVIYLLAENGVQAATLQRLAESLSRQAALVVRIDMSRVLAGLQDSAGGCVDFGADFEGLSHFIEAHYQLPTYHAPYFVGFSSGAALGYAVMAQAPTSTYAGVLSMDFCPSLEIRTPLCKGDDLHTAVHASSGSIELLPITRAHTRWVVQAAQAGQSCDARLTRSFLARVPQSSLITVKEGVLATSAEVLTTQILEAVGQLQAKPASAPISAAAALTDLPLVEVIPAGKAADTFAILLSGDGGWTGLDKDVAAALAARGVAVVGWDSLRYFWKARTPEGLAVDTKRIIDQYSREWQKSHVLLLGYSQGANVLPFLANRLPETARRQVSLIAMTGLGTSADFEFHFANWVASSQQALPVLPEIARLSGLPAICIYGQQDDESACPQLDQKLVRSIPLPGGHHFNGNYGAVADAILRAAKID